MVRWLLFMTMFTLVWVVFLLDVGVGVLLQDTRIGSTVSGLVPSGAFGRTLLLILLYLLIMIGFGMARHRLAGNHRILLGRMSDMKGLSVPYAVLGVAFLLLLILAFEFSRLSFSLVALTLLAAATLLLTSLTPNRSATRLLLWLRFYLFSFMNRLPFIGRYFSNVPPVELQREIAAGGTPPPSQGTPVMRGGAPQGGAQQGGSSGANSTNPGPAPTAGTPGVASPSAVGAGPGANVGNGQGPQTAQPGQGMSNVQGGSPGPSMVQDPDPTAQKGPVSPNVNSADSTPPASVPGGNTLGTTNEQTPQGGTPILRT